jgi:hypothetical protein
MKRSRNDEDNSEETRAMDMLLLAAGDPKGDAGSLWSSLASPSNSSEAEFWSELLRCVLFASSAAVDCFWLHTWPLWRSPDTSEELLDLLQECALLAKEPWLLRKLLESGVYEARRNKPDMLRDVGSVEACRLLMTTEGFRVNDTCGDDVGFTPLFDVRTRAVASCLLDAGANMSLVLLNEARLPPARVLGWLLDLRPLDAVWPPTWRHFFKLQPCQRVPRQYACPSGGIGEAAV